MYATAINTSTYTIDLRIDLDDGRRNFYFLGRRDCKKWGDLRE